MPLVSLLAYPCTHWNGLQGLAWSFWINLVVLRVAISVAQSLIVVDRVPGVAPLDFAWVILWIVAHIIIFLWQAVGVLSSGERHIRQLGSVTSTWGTQLGILIALFFVLSDIWSVRLMANPPKDPINFADRMDREHSAKYNFQLSDDKKTLVFSGEIAPGTTKTVTAFLAANPDVETLSLTGHGGNIYEARGLAKMAREAQLDTLALDVCSSACTVAFIGGVSRRLAPGARLGFHQYRVDATYDLPFADPLAEQERDLALFRASGVKDWFLDFMFHKQSEDIWYPSIAELERAGVVISN
jgi:hypothetical protein